MAQFSDPFGCSLFVMMLRMASWLIPALKAVLPHVGDIVSYAMPAFTRKKPDDVCSSSSMIWCPYIGSRSTSERMRSSVLPFSNCVR